METLQSTCSDPAEYTPLEWAPTTKLPRAVEAALCGIEMATQVASFVIAIAFFKTLLPARTYRYDGQWGGRPGERRQTPAEVYSLLKRFRRLRDNQASSSAIGTGPDRS